MRLAPVSWFDHSDFDVAELVTRKAGRDVSVCIPALDEEATIGRVVATIRRELVERSPLVDEILVVDDGSSDRTAARAAEAGARVVPASEILAEHGLGRGKGQALWKATFACRGDIIVFCDADVVDFGAHYVTGLVGPLLVDERVALVKGAYERPLDGRARAGGRVTELTARPALSLLFPNLGHIAQPLAGESASRRGVLEQLPFCDGYGVETGLLVDIASRFGTESIAQVDLGRRTHRNRPLSDLGPQAVAVLEVALQRSGLDRGPREQTALVRPGQLPFHVRHGERPPLRGIAEYTRRHPRLEDGGARLASEGG